MIRIDEPETLSLHDGTNATRTPHDNHVLTRGEMEYPVPPQIVGGLRREVAGGTAPITRMQRRDLHATDRIAAFVDDATDNGARTGKLEILGLGDLSVKDRHARRNHDGGS